MSTVEMPSEDGVYPGEFGPRGEFEYISPQVAGEPARYGLDLPVPRPTTPSQNRGLMLAFARNPDGSRVVDLSDWPQTVIVRDFRPGHTRVNYTINFASNPIACRCPQCSQFTIVKETGLLYRGARCDHGWAGIYAKAIEQNVDIGAGPTLDDFGRSYDPTEPSKHVIREVVAEKVAEYGGLALVSSHVNIVSGGTKRRALRGKYSDAMLSEGREFYRWGRALMDEYPQTVKVAARYEGSRARGNGGFTLGQHLFAQMVRIYHNKSITWGAGWCNQFLVPEVRGFEGMEFPGASAMSAFIRGEQWTSFLDHVLLKQGAAVEPIGGNLRVGADGSGEGMNRFFDYKLNRRHGDKTKEGKPGQREMIVLPDGSQTVRTYFTVVALSCIDTHITCAVDVKRGPKGESPRVVGLLERAMPSLANPELYLGDGAHKNPVREAALKFGMLANTKYNTDAVRPDRDDPLFPLYMRMLTEPRRTADEYKDRYNSEAVFSRCERMFGGFIRSTQQAGPENEVRIKYIVGNILRLAALGKVYGVDLGSPDLAA